VTGPCNDTNETTAVTQAQPGIVTVATVSAVVNNQITDIATVTGGFNPTGTVTFTVYGPDDANCSGTPAGGSIGVPLTGATATGTFTPLVAGDYRWTATYNGDINNAPVTGPCNDTNETTGVTQASPSIATSATASAVVNTPIGDTATVSGGFNPTGTVTFSLFGPNNATCTGTPVFTSTVPLTGGAATSGTFTPTIAGTYRWTATYNGDTNNAPATGPCNADNETTTVTQAQPTMTTSATGRATVGQPISDTATLVGGFNPTGTITFNLYGPNDATCTGSIAFTSTVTVGNGNGTYHSGTFTPNVPGTYRWVAHYSGDANNTAFTGQCGDPDETTIVDPAHYGHDPGDVDPGDPYGHDPVDTQVVDPYVPGPTNPTTTADPDPHNELAGTTTPLAPAPDQPQVLAGETERPAPNPLSGLLPRTGAGIMGEGTLALLLLGAGLALMRIARRRRSQPSA
jgi:hypothetical protein